MKISHIAVGAATFVAQAVLPSAAVGLLVASPAALSGAGRRGLDLLEDATGGVPAPPVESPPPPSGPIAAEEAAALFPLEGRGRRKLTTEPCPNGVGHVDCVNGWVVTGAAPETCQQACGGYNNPDCCNGSQSCDGFTGRVCRDNSCQGAQACQNAKVDLISDSCRGGMDTCKGISQHSGSWGGYESFGRIIGSCRDGTSACHSLASYGTVTGNSIFNSCKNYMACANLASSASASLNGVISNSCNAHSACDRVATFGTISGDISNSCNGYAACQNVAQREATTIPHGLADCCDGSNSCNDATEANIPADCAAISTSPPTTAPTNSPTSSSIKAPIRGGVSTILWTHPNGNKRYFEFEVAQWTTYFGSFTDGERRDVKQCRDGQEIGTGVVKVHKPTDEYPSAGRWDPVVPYPVTPGDHVFHQDDILVRSDESCPWAPWEIELQDMDVSFAADVDDEITFMYLIGLGRDYEIFLLKKGCDAKALVDAALYNVTNSTAVFNATHQFLNVSYSIDKSAIPSSPIWNNITSAIEMCQVANLIEHLDDGPVEKLVVAQHKLDVSVNVDTRANFTIKSNLTGAKIFNETEEVDAAASVDAFKCDKDFNQNDDKLSPNDEMFTCVRSKDAAFKVETVDRMTISQDGERPLQVIVGDKVQIPSITSREYTTDGAIVGTRIPINLFNFVDGAFLEISGAITMKLADGTSRRLNVDLGYVVRNLQDETNEASYTVNVALQAAEESSIGLSNSAAGVAAAGLKGFAIAAFFLLL